MLGYLTFFIVKTLIFTAAKVGPDSTTKIKMEAFMSYWTEENYKIIINKYLHVLWVITIPYMIVSFFSLGLIFHKNANCSISSG